MPYWLTIPTSHCLPCKYQAFSLHHLHWQMWLCIQKALKTSFWLRLECDPWCIFPVKRIFLNYTSVTCNFIFGFQNWVFKWGYSFSFVMNNLGLFLPPDKCHNLAFTVILFRSVVPTSLQACKSSPCGFWVYLKFQLLLCYSTTFYWTPPSFSFSL